MENVFLRLLNMSITAGWLILVVIVLRFLLRRAPKWISCLLWAMVAVRLLCPISLESVFSMIPSSETIHHDTVVSAKPSIDSGVTFVDNAVNPVMGKSFAPKPGASVNPLQIWIFAASIVWLAGVCVMLLYAVISYLRLRYKVRLAVQFQKSVYISEFISSPFILGVIRPCIYLPTGLEEKVLQPVLAHEQAHLKRRDYFWKLLGYVLLAVYWFQPLCWVAYSLLCKDIELACDERVIKNYDSHEKKAYSEALLACSIKRHAIAACPLAFGEVGVKERIKSVLHYKKPAFWLIAAAMIACVIVAVCFLTDPVKEETGDGNLGTQAQENKSQGDQSQGTQTRGTGEPEEMEDTKGAVNSDNNSGEENANEDLVEKTLTEWTKAFVNRNAEGITALAADEVISDLESRDLLSGTGSHRSFGLSSPWPQDEEADILVKGFDDKQAEIYYYAWTSEPHVTVWKENLSYELRDGKYVITGEELIWFDNISSGAEFDEAYMGIIDGSRMDYHNEMGDTLNRNALLSSTDLYRSLFEPKSAAVTLLNLSEDSEEVKIERVFVEGNKVPANVGLNITFLKDNVTVPISMVQLYDKAGIWIPQNYYVDPYYRFMQLDWSEVRNKRLSMDSPHWEDIVCIGKIPEKNLTIYGYNDKECFGQGVAIEIGDDVNYFDWVYTSPRRILPECYWNEESRQLQVALNIYTGTGVSAWELHVLQHYDTGTLVDNVFDFTAFSDILSARVGYEYDEETGMLTLIDKEGGSELLAVEVPEGKVEGIELGSISQFILGDTITFQVEPGCFSEGMAVAEYDIIPTLEAEVLLQGSGEEIAFDLGEIRVKEE